MSVEVVAVDVDPDARRVALNAGASASVRTAQALPVVQGAIIMSPPSTHADALESLLPRRIPILCREPLTTRTSTAVSSSDIGRERLFMASEWELHPAIAALASRVRGGELGEITMISISSSSQTDSEDAAWTLVPAQLSILTKVLGRTPQVVSAACEREGTVFRSLEATLAPPSIHLAVRNSEGARGLEVVVSGTLGAASLSGSNNLPEGMSLFDGQGFMLAARAFIGYLDGGPRPDVSAALGSLQVHQVAGIRRMALLHES